MLCLATAAAGQAAGPAHPVQCPSGAGITSGAAKLGAAKFGALASAIRSGAPVDVLAIGSATTVGRDGGQGSDSFPFHAITALQTALPKVDFRLTVQGARGMTAQEMLHLLDAQLVARAYPLVLWQTGTVEAVRGTRPDSLHAALAAGVQHVRARGGDTVLIDPNYSRALRANTEIEPYMQVMRQVAGMPGAVLFPRYDLTRSWVQRGEIDVEKAPKAERQAAVSTLHRCVGEALAAFILDGAKQAGL